MVETFKSNVSFCAFYEKVSELKITTKIILLLFSAKINLLNDDFGKSVISGGFTNQSLRFKIEHKL